MNQTCKVCGEPAAGFHFGAFTCEGCKSFFGRSYNNLSSISECKNNGKCIIDKKNRTTCKACRLRKCYTVGMSKGGSRYGRRSNWFKIHCLLQEQQQQAVEAAGKAGNAAGSMPPNGFGDMAAAAAAAQQHMQQRSSHMAQHMGGLLGYPGYLPEMSPFLSAAAAAAATRHPNEANAAALPFFGMMNGLPNMGAAPQSAFQLPPHLLFPSYHPAAAAAAADAAYRSEMFQHRQSVDSSESQRYSPAERSSHSSAHEERMPSARQSPVLCVSGDEDQLEHHSIMSSHHSSSAASPVCASALSASLHHIHSPIAIRASPKPSPMHTPHSISTSAAVTPPASQPRTPEPASHSPQVQPLSFAVKMQSLSPVSVCSIGAETAAPVSRVSGATAATTNAADQDCPMDLSMKTSRSSVHSFNTSAGESDVQSDASEEELRQASDAAAATRRKFYQLSEQESDASSDATSEVVKRQKLVAETQSYNGFASNPTSLRGIFVCV